MSITTSQHPHLIIMPFLLSPTHVISSSNLSSRLHATTFSAVTLHFSTLLASFASSRMLLPLSTQCITYAGLMYNLCISYVGLMYD